MATEKRRRKKEGRQARLEAARAAARRRQRQRRLLTAVIVTLAIVALLAWLARDAGDDDDDQRADSGTTSTTATVPVTVPAGRTKPAVEVPPGPPPAELVSTDLIAGTGEAAEAGDEVTIHYVGVLHADGTEFDTSWDGEPATFDLDGLIAGWQQGIPGMQVGGRRQLVIPPDLAYGEGGQGSIPGNATLVFVIDLLAVS